MELYAVRIFVRQWDEACAFYGNALGLKERFRDDAMGWAEFDLGGPCLGIERIGADDTEGNAMVGRFVGISLRVDDITAVHSSLVSKGVTFTTPPEKQPWGGSLGHFRDPDGNVLTLLG
ncbi:MAG: VOC family protein [Pseudomonadota bacterium]